MPPSPTFSPAKVRQFWFTAKKSYYKCYICEHFVIFGWNGLLFILFIITSRYTKSKSNRMNFRNIIPALLITGAIAVMTPSCSSKVPDATVKSNVEAVMTPGVMVEVKDGVVTLSGTVNNDADKASAEAAAKNLDKKSGVKSVVNNISVTPPPPPAPASVTTTVDACTQQKVMDGLKDMKGVTVTFTEDKAVLTGEVTQKDRVKIMQMLASAKVKSDVSNLKNKQ